ncbi:DUF2071 domain-containing protein [Halobacillus litoralis]|uniref:Uncharacterized protein n=1 Tax=Halobacillus litoralis TaxID=45668 RepID=A0A410M9V0_9BACI|nr:hypothetical protein HLI_04035 [Halobacillus litoralis]
MMYDNILTYTNHRSSPLPNGKWLMSQRWESLLFMHFSIPENSLQEFIPEELELDCYQGEAWVTIYSLLKYPICISVLVHHFPIYKITWN